MADFGVVTTTVSTLWKLSFSAPLADALGLVRQKGLIACLTSLTSVYFTDIPTCEGDTGLSGYPTRRVSRYLVHMYMAW